MAIYPVIRMNKEDGDRGHVIIEVYGRKYRVFRTSPLFGDIGYGAVTVNGCTFTVYRAKKEDGDIGYGVVNIKKKVKKKPFRYKAQKLPDELAEIVRAWSELPEDIKAKVEDLVKNNMKRGRFK